MNDTVKLTKFFAKDVTKITGVKRNRLQAWMQWGFISPSIQVADGTGSRNIWSLIDLYNISAFKKVTESGLSRKVVADFLALGAVGPDMSDSELDEIELIVYIRYTDRIEVHAVPDRVINLRRFFAETTLEGTKIYPIEEFDDIYILNFQKIKRSVDEKAKELIKGWWKEEV